MSDDKPEDQYTDKETAERLDRALKRSFNMPHKPHKPTADPKNRPASKRHVRKGKSRS